MTESKTKATHEGVVAYLACIEDAARREDCAELVKLMSRATRQKPKMWGGGIVGFGSYHYKYESGREGDACATGFSSRKGDITIYLAPEFAGRDQLLGNLGKHKVGKGCLYIRRLSDVDPDVLEQLIAASYAERKRRYS